MSDAPLLGRDDAVPRRRWRWLLPLLVVGAIAVLAGTLVVHSEDVGRDSPKGVLNRYLTAVQHGPTAAAYALLCDGPSTPTLAAFTKEVAQERHNFGGIKRHRMGSASKLAGGDEIVTYTIQYHDTYRWYEARMTNKAHKWLVCGFKEIPRPEVRLPAGDLPVPPGYVDTGDTTTTL